MPIKLATNFIEIGLLLEFLSLQVFATTNLSVILLNNDSKDNFKGGTYDNFNFLYELRTSEMNLLLGTDCTGYCSYKNSTQYSNHDLDYDAYKAYCYGRIRDCVLYKEAGSSSFSAGFNSFFNTLNFFFSENVKAYAESDMKLRQSTCPICKCYCDNAQNSTLKNSICLDTIFADVSENRVITGVRFKFVDNILRIQIQEASLADEDIIDSGTTTWLPLEKCNAVSRMNYDSRCLQLDDLTAPENNVVVGISLKKNETNGCYYLSIQAKNNKIAADFKNISIPPTEVFKPYGSRKNVLKPDSDVPTTWKGLNVELSQSEKHYIKFQPESLKNDENKLDAELMPFMDIRDVISGNQMKPLKGVGIYWRGQEGYGGYLGLKIFI